MSTYSVNQYSIETLLTWIKTETIAIPEIQRPFVWNGAKVRDFIDSLYQNYPVGYLITWCNPDIRLKDGSLSRGKKILIDGQQRMTALLAALLGKPVIDQNYKQFHIRIAFHPEEKKFEVANAAIRKDHAWIPDISQIFANLRIRRFVTSFCEINPGMDEDEIHDSIEKLLRIKHNLLGLIDLSSDMEIETVTEVFVRINSQGVILNAADFAMSKMAANEQYGGHHLRKSIDYFCHLAVRPEAFYELSRDEAFSKTDYFRTMAWLKNEKEDIYDPSYTDMLRVAFTSEFKRGRLEDLVALLSGRNFVTRTYDEDIIEESYSRLDKAVRSFMNETNFKRFAMILRSAGFMNASMIGSQNTVNFAYVLYLTLRNQGMKSTAIESLVRRWFVMSVLTRRYTSSPETAFGLDIRNINEQGAASYLDSIEKAELSKAFWEVGLLQQLKVAVKRPGSSFTVFLASLVRSNEKAFLSSEHTVANVFEGLGQFHHIFPKSYLQKKGFASKEYNQVANYAMMQGEINLALGAKSPSVYFTDLWHQCETGKPIYGGIIDRDQLTNNLLAHCIPSDLQRYGTHEYYEQFLNQRRSLIADKIRIYYKSL